MPQIPQSAEAPLHAPTPASFHDALDLIVAPERFDPASRDRVAELTAGDAVLAELLVRALEDHGSLHRVAGTVHWTSPLPRHSGLRQAVHAQRAERSEPERTTLDLLALAGALDAARVNRIVGPGAVESLEADGLLIVMDSAEEVRLDLAPLRAQLLRARIPATTARELFERLFPGVEDAPAPSDPAALDRALEWAWDAEMHPPLIWLDRAGRAARAQRALAQRLRIADAIVAHPASDAEHLLTARLDRAEACRLGGDNDGARDALARARHTINAHGRPHENHLIRLAAARSELAFFGDHDAAAAIAVLDDAATELDEGPVGDRARLRLRAERAVRAADAGHVALALEEFRAIDALGDEDCRLKIGPAYVLALGQLGRVGDARRITARELPPSVVRAHEFPDASASLVKAAFLTNMFGGILDEAALTISLVADALAAQNSVHYDPAHTLLGEGLLNQANGNTSAAIAALSTCAESLRDNDPDGLSGIAWSYLAWALAAVGEDAASLRARDEAAVRITGQSRGVETTVNYALLLSELVRGGDVRQTTHDLTVLAETRGTPLAELRARHIAGYAFPERAAEQLVHAERLAAAMDAPIAALLVQHLREIAAGEPDEASLRALARAGLILPTARGADLTSREREVAVLASLGFSSKLIAEHLVLSKRTVDSHLARVFTKLGITTRDELAPRLRNIENRMQR